MSDGNVMTFSGVLIEPLNPDPALVNIEDIAHALANCCRFTGHVRSFYSVAQHSVLCSEIVPHEQALAGLLHDASEAYLSDISRPIKQQPEFGTVYRAAEERLMHVIAGRFGFDWPMPPEVKHADEVLLRSEQRDLMPPSPDLIAYQGPWLDARIKTWSPSRAKQQFMLRYRQLTEFSVAA